MKIKSAKPGKNTSVVEITNISQHGFWLFYCDKEFFLPFDEYPWFKKATIDEILDVRLLHNNHFYWKSLDVDLSLNIISNPESFPLLFNK